jgi:hypothetical protein
MLVDINVLVNPFLIYFYSKVVFFPFQLSSNIIRLPSEKVSILHGHDAACHGSSNAQMVNAC